MVAENVAVVLVVPVHDILVSAGGIVKNDLIVAVLFHPAELFAFALK